MKTGEDARQSLLAGINKVAKAIRGTLGPAATTAIIQREDKFPVVLNDGVSIAKAVHDDDPYVMMGISLIQQVAEEAQSYSGDGTTTATILAQSLCNLGSDYMQEYDLTPRNLVEIIEVEAEAIINAIEDCAIPANDLEAVASIAANNDPKLGLLIAEVMEKVGKDGVVSVEVGSGYETTYEMVNGFEIHSGSISPHFPSSMDDANVLLVQDKINSFNQLLPALEKSISENRGLLIIANDFNPRMLPNLLINVMQGKVNACVIKTPQMGKAQEDWLLDIQSVVHGPIYGKMYDMDISKVEVHGMGHITSMETKRDTTVIKTDTSPDEAHLDDLYQLRDKLDAQEDTDANEWETEMIERRIGRLTNGVASIRVGGYTEVELLETKERVDDAVNAVKHAMQDGIIPGGGCLLNFFGDKSEYDFIDRAFAVPMFTILDNAGQIDDSPYVPSTQYGRDALDGTLVDLVEAGIVDPVNVTINSIRSAVSIAKLVLTSDCLIPLR